VPIAVGVGERGDDVVRGMRDERRVVIGEQHSVALEELQQIGHLLQIRGHVRVIAAQVHVVELDLDHVLEARGEPAGRLLRIVAVVGGLRSNRAREQARGEGQRCAGAQDVPKPFHADLPCEKLLRAQTPAGAIVGRATPSP